MDIVVDAATVSRHHATLKITSKGYRLTDEGSTNGTRVLRDGTWQPVRQAYLRRDEVLELGGYRTTPGKLVGMATRSPEEPRDQVTHGRPADDRPVGPVRRNPRGRVVADQG